MQEADLLIHVHDLADPALAIQRQDVERVLRRLGLEEKQNNCRIDAYNKADIALAENRLEATQTGVELSALSGEGVTQLLQAIDEFLDRATATRKVILPLEAGKQIAWLYAHANVVDRVDGESEVTLLVRFTDKQWEQFQKLG